MALSSTSAQRFPRLPAGLGDHPQRETLREALREYAQTRAFWYIPKVRALNASNVQNIVQILQVVDSEFSSRLWNRDTQDDLLTRLIESGLLNPTADDPTPPSRTALTRIIKVLLETLGLLWIAEEQTPVVTGAGRELISAATDRPTEVAEVIARQVSKMQYPNPTMPKRYRDAFAGILPHLFLLDVLDRMGQSISFDEYNLFINLAVAQEDLERICKYIEAWRSLSIEQQHKLRSVFERVPMNTGASTLTVERSTRMVLVGRTASYQRSIYCFPPYLDVNSSRKTISLAVPSATMDFLQSVRANIKVTIYATPEDWFSYFGDPDQEPSWFTFVQHEITSATDSSAADAAVETHQDKLSESERQIVRKLQIERAIENAYATEPDLLHTLEPHLQFQGRQIKTPIGQIDLLCRGADDRYIVIEIKASAAEDAVFGQILRYMGWIHRNYADGEHNVRGIILASSFLDRAQYSRIGLMREDAEQFLRFRRHAFMGEEV